MSPALSHRVAVATPLDRRQGGLLRLWEHFVDYPEMTRMAQQWRSISEEQLSRLVERGTYSGAFAALQRVRKIMKAGHTPAVFHDKLNGFMVLDQDDPEQIRRIAELRHHLKVRRRRMMRT